MSGKLVGEVFDNAERLRNTGALGGPNVAHRNLIALLAVAEGCREESRSGYVAQSRVAKALGGVRKTASRALADLSSAGLIEVVQRGTKASGGDGRPTLYRLAKVSHQSEGAQVDGTPKVSHQSGDIDGTPKESHQSESVDRLMGHLSPIDGTPEPDRWDSQGVPLPVRDFPLTTSRLSSTLATDLTDARASNDVVDNEPSPEADPIAWVDQSLPQGFLAGERAVAEQLLADGDSPASVRYAILRQRSAELASRRAKSRGAAVS